LSEPESFDAFEAAQARIVGAVLAFDPELVEREVSRAIYLGSAVTVFERVLGPVMRQVGDLWHEGTVSVAQEHIASGVVGNVVRGLARLVQPAAPSRRVVLGCVEDEEHVLGLYGVAIRLASWGIRSVELGARTPPEAVADAVARIAPDGVGLSMTMAPEPARGARTDGGLRRSVRGRAVVCGRSGCGPRRRCGARARGPGDRRRPRGDAHAARAGVGGETRAGVESISTP
jgi:cobalamin-dependent methionine synthase I